MIGIRTSYFVISIVTILVGSALFILQGCKPRFPFSCSGDSDCVKGAYCDQEVCVDSTCKKDLECLGGRKCFNSKCEVPKTCKPGQTRCDSSSSMQTCGEDNLWGEAVDCLAGQLCGVENSDLCGACSSEQQCVEAASYGFGFICVKGNCIEGDCHYNLECLGAQTCGGAGVPNMCGCPLPPNSSTETPIWPEISKKETISDLAYDFTSTPGEVLDKQTCLVWKRYPSGDSGTKQWNTYNWNNAKAVCTTLGGGWRLPTKIELESIVDPYKKEKGITPPINTNAFPDNTHSPFWTTSEDDSGSVWYVSFYDGYSHLSSQSNYRSVRCVR